MFQYLGVCVCVLLVLIIKAINNDVMVVVMGASFFFVCPDTTNNLDINNTLVRMKMVNICILKPIQNGNKKKMNKNKKKKNCFHHLILEWIGPNHKKSICIHAHTHTNGSGKFFLSFWSILNKMFFFSFFSNGFFWLHFFFR